MKIILGSRLNEQGVLGGDPAWPCYVERCYSCCEAVGEDNELPFKEIHGLYYCNICEDIIKIQAAVRGYLSRRPITDSDDDGYDTADSTEE